MNTATGGLMLVIVCIVALAIHFLPTIIAFNRNHPNRMAILLLNIFLGWTGLGWIIALIWSATNIKA